MKLFRMRIMLSLAIAMAMFAGDVTAQGWRQPPVVGYAYPAGGEQGKTFIVTVGGQYLKDVTKVYVSGEGVSAKVVDYIRPANQKELQKLREIWKQSTDQMKGEAKKGERPRWGEIRKLFIEKSKEMGVTERELEAFFRFRQERQDPKRQLNPQISESVKLEVTVAGDADLGLREIRVMTEFGLSNAVNFFVGQLAESQESEPNDSLVKATKVAAVPVVLNGQIMPGDVDYFRFYASKGEQLVVQVQARDIVPYLADAVPGWFQAVVAVYDADGREVAYADDNMFDPDPALLFECPADSEYVLEIRDSIYRGREDFVYRISLGELPYITGVFPLGGQRGKGVTARLQGWNLEAEELYVDVSSNVGETADLQIVSKGYLSNTRSFAVGELSEVVEVEPNDDVESAERVMPSLVVNGRIDRQGDWDVFRFTGHTGQEVFVEVHARRLGSPLDSLVMITDADGNELGVNDDNVDQGYGLVTHHADSMLSVTIPAIGDYLVWIGDTQGNGGDEYGYRMRVSSDRPGFELRVLPSVINTRRGDNSVVTVHALRRDGFTGEIKLGMKDSSQGFVISGGVIPAGEDNVKVTLGAPTKQMDGLVDLQMEGVATVGSQEIRRLAVPADDTMQAFIYHHLVVTDKWVANVSPKRWGMPQAKVKGKLPVVLKAGKTREVRIVGTPKRVAFSEIRVELVDPPKGVAIGKVSAEEDGIAVEVIVDGETVLAGGKGNLIFKLSREFQPMDKEGKARGKKRKYPMGVLPAVGFEVAKE